MNNPGRLVPIVLWLLVSVWIAPSAAGADAVTDWNQKACDIVVAAKLTPAGATKTLAIVQTSVFEAVNAITRRYPGDGPSASANSRASVDAAVAAANRVTLTKLLPSQQAAVDAAYQAAVATIAEGPSKADGVAAGEKAAAAVLARRADDLAEKPDSYRPYTKAGVYVSTTIPVNCVWPERTPWLMRRADQFRPAPPPELTSALWVRDYNEIKELGGKNSPRRTAEQTTIARFWEATQPSIYQGLVRSAAGGPGREITQNARLFAAVSQALDDAYIAVFDAKYHYNFWRPITAIRNGDIDGNDATERDATWLPFIDTPMHPEYPCAHCILSGAAGTILQAEFASGPPPSWSTTSSTANGATRTWSSLDDFMQEVASARIYDGVHFRNSTEVGTAMGKKIGALAVSKFLTRGK